MGDAERTILPVPVTAFDKVTPPWVKAADSVVAPVALSVVNAPEPGVVPPIGPGEARFAAEGVCHVAAVPLVAVSTCPVVGAAEAATDTTPVAVVSLSTPPVNVPVVAERAASVLAPVTPSVVLNVPDVPATGDDPYAKMFAGVML